MSVTMNHCNAFGLLLAILLLSACHNLADSLEVNFNDRIPRGSASGSEES